MGRNSVSVVIPTRDRFAELYRAIDSVFNQTFENWELIVVIDSSDNFQYVEICQELSKVGLSRIGFTNDRTEFLYADKNLVTVLRNMSQTRNGAAYARNMGIANSNSNFVAFLDSDDEWLSEKLDLQISYMCENGLWACHTDYLVRVNELEKVTRISTKVMRGKTLAQRIAFRECLIATPTVIYDKSCYNMGNELFPAGLVLGEDLVAWMRLAAADPKKFGHLDAALTLVNVDEHSSKHKSFDDSIVKFIEQEIRILGIKEISPLKLGGHKRFFLRMFLANCPEEFKHKLRYLEGFVRKFLGRL